MKSKANNVATRSCRCSQLHSHAKNSKDFEFKRGIQNPPRVLARENTAEHKKISTVDVTFLPK